MTINPYLRRFLFVFLILVNITPLLQAQDAGYEEGEPRLFQRLVWTGGEYALRFEVAIEREVDGTYITQLQESTEASFIEVSLPLGHYRFQVTSYNILDKPEEVSQWVSFDIIAVDTNDTPEPSDALKPMLIIAGAAWAPVFPLHGDFFGDGFSLAGAGAHFGVAFPVPRGLYLGAEVTAFWHINNANTDNDKNVLLAGINLLTMKWLQSQATALNFRLGVSFIVLPETQDRLVFNMGASYLWRFTGKFLLEAGFDYASRLEDQLFDGCIRPWIGVGMVF